EGVFEYRNKRLPVMYFYQKMTTVQNEIKDKIMQKIKLSKTLVPSVPAVQMVSPAVPSVPLSSIQVGPVIKIGTLAPHGPPLVVKKNLEDLPTVKLPTIPGPRMSPRRQILPLVSGTVRFPSGISTIVPEVPPEQIKVVPVQQYGTLAYTHDITYERQRVLDHLISSKHRLTKEKPSSKNQAYSLIELKEFAKQLGIRVNQNKANLVDEILQMVNQREGQLRA
ncbi:MAG TPA: hypothetical protein VKR58_11855, partial [Aquella sp.]|nr:hypothetical protein [Aquella sp.]